MPAIDGAALLECYQRNGYVVARRAVARSTVEEARRHLARLQAGPAGRGPLVPAPLATAPLATAPLATAPLATAPLATAALVEAPRSAAALAARPELAGLARLLLGRPECGVRPFGCTYIVKAALTGPPAGWHQDGYPWRTSLGIRQAVTLWIALDDTGPANGCLQVIPGSHRLGSQPLRPTPAGADLFGHELDPDYVRVALARARPVDVALAAGDLSAHHPDLVHGSPANHSPLPRRALVIRYRAG